jgi:hypothetical protein
MAEVFSDDFNLKIGDLLSRLLSPATCQTCAGLFMLTRTIQAPTYMFARAPFYSCAPATRTYNLSLEIGSHVLSPGDLPSRHISYATSPPCAHPYML